MIKNQEKIRTLVSAFVIYIYFKMSYCKEKAPARTGEIGTASISSPEPEPHQHETLQ
jgi:hypothetical protein